MMIPPRDCFYHTTCALEFFYGKVAYRDELWQGRHEPIITKELFDRVKEVRARHARRPRSHIALEKVRQANLLRGIVCCSACERPLRIQSTRQYGYYGFVNL